MRVDIAIGWHVSFLYKKPHDIKNVQLFPDKEPHYFYKTTQIILAFKAQLLLGSM